jgi:hypothetical protein
MQARYAHLGKPVFCHLSHIGPSPLITLKTKQFGRAHGSLSGPSMTFLLRTTFYPIRWDITVFMSNVCQMTALLAALTWRNTVDVAWSLINARMARKPAAHLPPAAIVETEDQLMQSRNVQRRGSATNT